jgi:LTXXQ motif family protein
VNRRTELAAVLTLAASTAAAQFGGRRRGGGMQDGSKARGGADGAPGKAEPTPALEVSLHELEEDLKLRPEQAPLFDKYAEGVRALANDVARDRRREGATNAVKAGVLERIDRSVDALRNRLTAVEDIAQAAKALYASLDPTQQAAADPRLATLMVLPLGPGSESRPMKPPAGGRGPGA